MFINYYTVKLVLAKKLFKLFQRNKFKQTLHFFAVFWALLDLVLVSQQSTENKRWKQRTIQTNAKLFVFALALEDFGTTRELQKMLQIDFGISEKHRKSWDIIGKMLE